MRLQKRAFITASARKTGMLFRGDTRTRRLKIRAWLRNLIKGE